MRPTSKSCLSPLLRLRQICNVGTADMMESETDIRLAWTFLVCSMYSLLVVVYFGISTLLGTYNVDLAYRLQSNMSPLSNCVLSVGALAAQVVCMVCAIVACACTKFRTLEHPQWRVGGSMLIVMWLVIVAFILTGPWHAPPD
jgi:hypothetical protein